MKSVIDGWYSLCHPMAVGFIVLNVVPEAVFIVEFNGEIHAFEVGIVPYVVSHFQICCVLEILFRYSSISSTWNDSTTLKVVYDPLRHQVEVQLNVTRQ